MPRLVNRLNNSTVRSLGKGDHLDGGGLYLVVEAALSHIVGDRVEQAYRRGDALDRRRRLMEDWAGFLG